MSVLGVVEGSIKGAKQKMDAYKPAAGDGQRLKGAQ